jgi:oxygen-independent coproporphyrinogen-3 oxidase
MLYSLYLHIPFCAHRCAYCDFNTFSGQESLIPPYVGALCQEVRTVGRNAPAGLALHTVYFGGGTPSLLSAEDLASIVAAIRDAFDMAAEAEITLEANPGTTSIGELQAMRRLEINRISLGVQSANGLELRMLERQHSFLDVLEAVSAARRAGFDNLNLDLIYGLPEQTLRTWQTTVRRALDLKPEHVSAYALTLEHGTPFGRWHERGLLPIPSADLAADMYEWISEELEAAGYGQYEISNWAKPGRACRHNLQYWRGLPYLGVGAGAHGYAEGYRYSNVLGIGTYIQRLGGLPEVAISGGSESKGRNGGFATSQPAFPLSPAVVNHHRQSRQDEMCEYMITGLRLTREGVAERDFRSRFGAGLREVYAKELEELTGLGLLEWVNMQTSEMSARIRRDGEGTSEVVRLTRRGRLLGNQAFIRFVAVEGRP